MSTLTLCRERLDRIRSVLEDLGGKASIRDLWRSYTIYAWEIEQAAELGWLSITIRKPRVGRPSRIVEFRDTRNAKLPPLRADIEKEISIRHWSFALRSVCGTVRRGARSWGIPATVWAYIETYHPRSRNAAYASASRLLRHPDVRAARQWLYAQSHELPPGEVMPRTARGIQYRLRELGSWRADRC